jgi:CelD/BcsL family acetyltransferase involved in cellulose biosynthesis
MGMNAESCRGVQHSLLTRATDLDVVGPDWRRIEPQLLLPSQGLAWAKSGAMTFGGDRLRVYVVETPELAVAPLVWREGDRMLESLATFELYAPSDLAFGSTAALEALLDAIGRGREPLRLARLPAESPTIAAARRVFGGHAIVLAKQSDASPYIDLAGSGGDADALLKRAMRGHLRRSRRIALSMAGEMHVDILDRHSANALAPLRQLAFEIEARSWKGEAGTALLHDPARRRFFELYTDMAWEQGALTVAFLRLGGVPVATQISVEHSGMWCTLKLGYDAAYAACSPGSLLKHAILQHAVSKKLDTYEFFGAPAPWTRRWTDDLRACVDLRIYPASKRGATTFLADAGTWTRKRLQSRPPLGPGSRSRR